MTKMQFPLHYRPRPYQMELHKMWSTKRIGVAVLPRQSGKDMAMITQAVHNRLTYERTTSTYVSLDSTMIRNIIWDKTYFDPVSGEYVQALMGNIPEGLVSWSKALMEGTFHNGSKLKLQGYFQGNGSKNGVGTAFQEYAFTELALFDKADPLPLLMPILSNEQEKKRLMVASTPRGKRNNPLWQLMQAGQSFGKEFQVIVRTIDDLNAMMRKEGLPPVRSQELLEQDREFYLKRFGNDRMFEQEYYCTFDEIDASAVYGIAYKKLVTENRDASFNLNRRYPVYVVFDIGSAGKTSDATSWIAFQYYNGKIFIYDCGEGHGKPLPDYITDLRAKHYFHQIAKIILPHDAENHNSAVIQTPADMVRQVFSEVAVLARSKNVYRVRNYSQTDQQMTDIQVTRIAMDNMYINGELCQWLLECIENYRYSFDTSKGEWSATPNHDKHSHMMDALRYAVQATNELDLFQGEFMDSAKNFSGKYTDDWLSQW